MSDRLPLTQIRVLKLLKGSKNPLTIKDFSEKGCGYGPSISNFVGRVHEDRDLAESRQPTLIELGLVKALLPDEGSRSYRFQITSKGAKELEKSLKAIGGKIPELRVRNVTKTPKPTKESKPKAPKSAKKDKKEPAVKSK